MGNSQFKNKKIQCDLGGPDEFNQSNPNLDMFVVKEKPRAVVQCAENMEYRLAFDMVDENGHGQVMFDETLEILKQMNRQLGEEDWDLLQELEFDPETDVNMDEIRDMIERNAVKMTPRDQFRLLKAAFNKFDDDGSGMVSVDKLHAVLTELRVPRAAEASQWTIDSYDMNGDGALDFREFTAMMVHRHNLPLEHLVKKYAS